MDLEMLSQIEKECINSLNQALEKFSDLQVEHTYHDHEFQTGIHRLQDLILARAALRFMHENKINKMNKGR